MQLCTYFDCITFILLESFEYTLATFTVLITTENFKEQCLASSHHLLALCEVRGPFKNCARTPYRQPGAGVIQDNLRVSASVLSLYDHCALCSPRQGSMR